MLLVLTGWRLSSQKPVAGFLTLGGISMSLLKIMIALVAVSLVIFVGTLVLVPRHYQSQRPPQQKPPQAGGGAPVAEGGGKGATDLAADLPSLVRAVKDDVVTIQTYDKFGAPIGMGTGFFLDSRTVATSRHVIAGASRAEIKSRSGKAVVLGASAEDTQSDLAILLVQDPMVTGKGLPLSPTAPEVGERVFVIGNPLGLEATVSDGIVSGKPTVDSFGQVIQVTSPISPGSSGSPVFNSKGDVIGIAAFQMVDGQNLNFAIPISRVSELWAQARVSSDIKLSALTTINPVLLDSMPDPTARGEFLLSKNEYEAAARELQKAVAADPKNAKAHYLLGKCYRVTAPSEALAELDAATTLNPNATDFLCEKGMCYLDQHDTESALSCFRRALAIDPKHVDSIVGVAAVHLERKEIHRAEGMLVEAVRANEDDTAYLYLGWVYLALHKEDEALVAFKRAIELNSELAEAYKGLTALYLQKADPRPGLHYAVAALARNPHDLETHYLMGLMHAANGDKDGAHAELRLLEEAYRNSDGINGRDPKLDEWTRQLRSSISQRGLY